MDGRMDDKLLNLLARAEQLIGRIEADLEGFARDLRELLLSHTPDNKSRPGATDRG